jgi:hypothetical protein
MKKMEPLGLPKGSVRAIILVLLTLGITFPVFIFVFTHQEIPATVDKYLGTLMAGVILLIREYLGLRGKQDENETKASDTIAEGK